MIANAVALGFRDLIGFTLTTAAGAKLVSLDGFEMTLIGLGLLPTRGTPSRYLAIVIALAEALTGLLLISGIAPFAITIVASGMLLSFLCAILIALSRRLEIACHCFRLADRHAILRGRSSPRASDACSSCAHHACRVSRASWRSLVGDRLVYLRRCDGAGRAGQLIPRAHLSNPRPMTVSVPLAILVLQWSLLVFLLVLLVLAYRQLAYRLEGTGVSDEADVTLAVGSTAPAFTFLPGNHAGCQPRLKPRRFWTRALDGTDVRRPSLHLLRARSERH